MPVEPVEVAVIGTGWCGGIRAETLSRYPLVKKLHVCEIRPDRLKEIKDLTNAAIATADYQDIVNILRQREISWAVLGEKLGVSRQAAWKRFG